MAVVIETTVGDLTVDLFLKERPRACLNFLKLCKLKYYNYNLFHTIERGFIAQTGDPTGVGDAGESVWGLIEGPDKRFFEAEYLPKIRHTEPGLLSMVSLGNNLIGSQFFFTLGSDQTSLDGVHCVIGQVVEGLDVLRTLNDAICDTSHRPYQDIRITHTVILEDPFENPRGFREPSRSPSPSENRLRGGRIGADEDIDDTSGKTGTEINEMLLEREAKARATILEIVGDLPDAEIAPPENVLFVCKLNSVTTDDDLEIIFSRFGKVKGCEVIRDRVTNDSLQYAFVEFEDTKTCEAAYFKMDNVLIDDRRIHVDFSQSVSKVQWRGKGRGLVIKDGSKNNRIDFSNYKQSNKERNNERRNERTNERHNERNTERNYRGNIASNRPRFNDSNRGTRDYDNRRNVSPRRNNSDFDRRRRNSPYANDRKRASENLNRRRPMSRSPRRYERSNNTSNRERSQSPRRNNDSRLNRRSRSRSHSRNRGNVRRRDDTKQESSSGRYRDNHRAGNDSRPIINKRDETREKSKRSRSPVDHEKSSSSRKPKNDEKSKKHHKESSESAKKTKKESTKKHRRHASSGSSSSD